MKEGFELLEISSSSLESRLSLRFCKDFILNSAHFAR